MILKRLLIVPAVCVSLACGPTRADRLQAELTTLRGKVVRLTGTIADLQSKLSDLEESADEVRATVDAFDDSQPRAGIENIDEALGQLEDDLDTLRSTVDDLGGDIRQDATHARRETRPDVRVRVRASHDLHYPRIAVGPVPRLTANHQGSR